MNLSKFKYDLPKKLITQEPIKPRDHSRLLVLDRKTGKTEHKHFFNITDYLQEGDVLVFNNSKVFPARLIGKKETGGKIEVFLLKKIKTGIWLCLLGGKSSGEKINIKFSDNFSCQVLKKNNDSTWLVKFNKKDKELIKLIERHGQTPLPPYIKRTAINKKDKNDYQTVYASSKKIGSVAAPTAGFHFTRQLIKKLKKKGVQLEYLALHVGLGTFAPVKNKDINKHRIHAELAEVDKTVAKNIVDAKKAGRRIIAVGTTSVRVLEGLLAGTQDKKDQKIIRKLIDIFIYPPYKFKLVDGMITNFHLPESTLLMLVSAFVGENKKNQKQGLRIIKQAYEEAIKKEYRFYSYGDVMFIE